MRDISEVIDQIAAVVPLEESGLHIDLDKLRTSCAFTAPEVMPERWQQLGFLLEDSLGEPAGVAWKEQVQAIVTAKAQA
jgi:hypothetical protein